MLTSDRLGPRRTVTIVACLLACGLALFMARPSAANAEASTSETSADITLKGSDGSLISVHAAGGEASFSVSPRPPRLGNQERSEYTVPASTSGEAIQANFGSFGEISVHFVPSGIVKTKIVKLPPHCSGPKKIVRREGTFVGTISFSGENGYTSVDTNEAVGSVGTPVWFACVIGGPAEAPGSHRRIPTLLNASMTGRKLGFEAVLRRRGQIEFSAAETAKAGDVSILRIVAKRSRPSRFRFDRALRMATVAPPAPFSGTATFRRGAKGSSPAWSGSLAVSFPGKPDVPLVGSPFTKVTLGAL